MISQSPAQQIEGLVACMDMRSNAAIIPLTITEVVHWICLKEEDAQWVWNRPTDTQSHDEVKVFDMIRRLEPVGDSIRFVLKSIDEWGGSPLHWAAKFGHDDCIHIILKMDPTMTKMVE
eukprot:PhF_6_TR25743/c0_g1_i3/m.36281